MSRRAELAVLAIILAAYALLLGRTIDHGFVWDDIPEIATNRTFDEPLLDGIVLTQIERAEPGLADLPSLQFGYDSYRPLLFASYWLDIHVWGRGPGPLHAMNVVFGALAILLAYAVARRWLGSPLALIPTALFALHPIQIEAVAYISARGDLLAGMFALAATYAVLRAADGRVAVWMTVAAVAFAASLLAKEAYLALPFALAVVLASRPASRARWWLPAILLGVAIAYVPFRSAMLTTKTAPPFLDGMVTAPAVAVDYLRGVLLPFELSIERLPSTNLIVGWIVAVAVLAGAAYTIKKHGLVTEIAGLAWTVLQLGPSLVVVVTMNVVADRYFYLPMLGLGIAATAAIARLRPKLRRVVVGIASLWAVLVLVVAWRQVPFWRDVTSLYSHAAELTPDSSRAQYRVAYLAIAADRWDLAVPRLERALELDPANTQALNNLGVYYLRTGRFAESEALLARAVAANPARFNSWLNLGLAQHSQFKRDAGCASIARAMTINPRFTRARDEYARLCSQGGVQSVPR